MADRSKTDEWRQRVWHNPDDLLPVTVSIPVAAIEYSHIHFGVWAGLGAKGWRQELADLGIGFVQNIDGSGMTERQGIGTATFNGDWVAAVRRQYASDAEAGAIKFDSGSATLTADFEDGEFTGVLAGLATLEGTLSGNGFSGTKATASRTMTWTAPAPSRASSAAASTGRPARRPLASSTSTATKPARSRCLRRDSVANPAILGSNQYRRPVRQRVGRLFLTPSRRNSHAS